MLTNEELQTIAKMVADEVVRRLQPQQQQQQTAEGFTPPTPDEVAEYIRENGLSVNVEQWHAYYTRKGWKINGETMNNWKGSVLAWSRRADEKRAEVEETKRREAEIAKNDAERLREAERVMVEWLRCYPTASVSEKFAKKEQVENKFRVVIDMGKIGEMV